MPKINWNEFGKLKHQLSQERVIICGVILDHKLSIKRQWETIKRLRKLDKRLERFENRMIRWLMRHSNDQN